MVETRSLLQTAAKLKRLSFGMRLLSLLPDPAGRKPDKPWGGVCVLENKRTNSFWTYHNKVIIGGGANRPKPTLDVLY